jgi:hypothetical protein
MSDADRVFNSEEKAKLTRVVNEGLTVKKKQNLHEL